VGGTASQTNHNALGEGEGGGGCLSTYHKPAQTCPRHQRPDLHMHHLAPFRSFREPRTTRRVSFRKRLDVFVHICPGARCSTATWSLTLTLSSKMSNCG